MRRDELVGLLRQMSSAVSSAEYYEIVSYCWNADRAIVDYCGDESLVDSYYGYVATKDYKNAISVVDEAMKVIFDAEINDCYDDLICAVCERPPQLVN